MKSEREEPKTHLDCKAANRALRQMLDTYDKLFDERNETIRSQEKALAESRSAVEKLREALIKIGYAFGDDVVQQALGNWKLEDFLQETAIFEAGQQKTEKPNV